MHDMYVIHTCYVLRVHHAQIVYTTQHSMYTTTHTQGRIHTVQYTLHYTMYIHTSVEYMRNR